MLILVILQVSKQEQNEAICPFSLCNLFEKLVLLLRKDAVYVESIVFLYSVGVNQSALDRR